MPPNFKVVGATEAELHILKVEKSDACIRPLFANSVTYREWLSLCFKFLPPSHNQCNNKSTETNQKFEMKWFRVLLTNRCIRRVEAEPWVCSPLSVVSNPMGKLRLVLNFRYANQFLHVTKFKYEDLCLASLMFKRNEYMLKFDLKSGYHHIDICCEHPRYVGFRWDTKSSPQFYVFTVLPFGLSTACYVFYQIIEAIN